MMKWIVAAVLICSPVPAFAGHYFCAVRGAPAIVVTAVPVVLPVITPDVWPKDHKDHKIVVLHKPI